VKTRWMASIAASGVAVSALAVGVVNAGTVPPDTGPAATGAAASVLAPDASFGTDGLLTANVNDAGHDRYIGVATGADGSAYASGFVDVGDGDHAFLVSKFTAEGALDDSYGDGGSAIVNVVEGGGDAEVARGLVVGDDGSVTIAGPADHDPAAAAPDDGDADAAVVRLDPTGALDTAFGDGGIAIFDFGAGKAVDKGTYLADNTWGLAGRDGGYVVFASTPNQGADRVDTDFVIAGLTDVGALDETFGEGGTVVVDVNTAVDNARRIKIDDQGRVVAVGYSSDGDGIVSPTLIRLTPEGVLDESFGGGGVANHIVLDAVTEAYNVTFQGDAYVMSGYGRDADSETVDQVTYRFTADGAWDESFGDGGVTRIDLAGQDDRGRDVVTLTDGSIVVVGSGKLDETNLDGLVVQLDANGIPVAGFGDNGTLLTDFGGANDAFFGVTVSDDGSTVYVAGYKGGATDTDEQDDAVLLRLTVA
jgi:uncharacterized delta-60 repeat protein